MISFFHFVCHASSDIWGFGRPQWGQAFAILLTYIPDSRTFMGISYIFWPFAIAEKVGYPRGWVLSIQWSHLLFSTCDHNHLQSKQSPLYLFSKGEKSFTHVHSQFLKDLVEGLFERFNCPINVVQFV